MDRLQTEEGRGDSPRSPYAGGVAAQAVPTFPDDIAAVTASISALVPSSAVAGAEALITLNELPFTGENTQGYGFRRSEASVGAFSSADFDWDWTITLKDDGLPVSRNSSGGFFGDPTECLTLSGEHSCAGLAYTGYEQARASLALSQSRTGSFLPL